MNQKENGTTKVEKQLEILTGEVVSTKMKDTAVVSISRYRKYPKYGKYLVRSKRLKAHDAGNTCSVGDIVTIKQTRPISKEKHYVVVQRVKIKEQNEEVRADSEE